MIRELIFELFNCSKNCVILADHNIFSRDHTAKSSSRLRNRTVKQLNSFEHYFPRITLISHPDLSGDKLSYWALSLLITRYALVIYEGNAGLGVMKILTPSWWPKSHYSTGASNTEYKTIMAIIFMTQVQHYRRIPGERRILLLLHRALDGKPLSTGPRPFTRQTGYVLASTYECTHSGLTTNRVLSTTYVAS